MCWQYLAVQRISKSTQEEVKDWGFTYVLVTSGNNGDDAGSSEGFDGAVDSLREGTPQGHVHNSLAALSVLLDVVDHELHAVEDTRVAAAAVGVEDLDCDEVDLLGNAKGGSADGTSNVAAVTVLIIVLEIMLAFIKSHTR